ncbi:MAG: C-terminal binding protein [Chloroflexi bacterium]|nr:C-terminal binding protein [Chloroflexota bacterium]
MQDWTHLEKAKVVRLNAVLNPNQYEAAIYREYHLNPIHVEATTPDELIAVLEDCDALFAVSVKLPTPVIEGLKKCKVISRLGTGTDKIDVAKATERGIVVTNVPYFCVEEQADHAMALLLSLERKLPQMDAATRAGEWNKARYQSHPNRRLSVLTLGLVGFGNSARETARRAKGFGMRVLATRRNMISLHLPLEKETYHLLDETALRKMKPSAYLINTSRGAIVDEMALVELLRANVIAGAGLDTYEHIDVFIPDGPPPAHPLLQLDNVILTPHVAAMSIQAAQDVARGGVENMVSILSGHWPIAENIVNRGVKPWFPLQEYDPTLLK